MVCNVVMSLCNNISLIELEWVSIVSIHYLDIHCTFSSHYLHRGWLCFDFSAHVGKILLLLIKIGDILRIRWKWKGIPISQTRTPKCVTTQAISLSWVKSIFIWRSRHYWVVHMHQILHVIDEFVSIILMPHTPWIDHTCGFTRVRWYIVLDIITNVGDTCRFVRYSSVCVIHHSGALHTCVDDAR